MSDWLLRYFFDLCQSHRVCISLRSEKRNISDERQALHEALKLLEVELSKSESQCLEKNQPGLGDLWIYGVLRGLEGLPVHDEIMSEYEEIPLWYHRMRKSVEA